IGALVDPESEAYLRPETAQGIFVNFRNVLDTSRVKLPFGIAQIGKSFRNEITPRNFTFRTREFEQMEIEFFCHPDTSPQWYTYWRDRRFQWYIDLGLQSDKLRLRDHDPDELSHYSCGTADVEYAYPFLEAGQFGELEGIAHRGDFDLRSHMEGKLVRDGDGFAVELGEDGKPKYPGSGKDLRYFDPQTRERFIPHVIEPSAGADRATLAFLCEAYTEDAVPDTKGELQSRVVMKFHPRLAPIKVAVFPLVKRDGMPEIARELYRELKQHWNVFYDESGSIGRRYRRQDESGTPFCVTVDSQTLDDGAVTVRDRDTTEQLRVPGSALVNFVRERLNTPSQILPLQALDASSAGQSVIGATLVAAGFARAVQGKPILLEATRTDKRAPKRESNTESHPVAERLRVAAIQMSSLEGAIAENLRRAEPHIADAVAQGAQLVLLPEFLPSGYVYTTDIWKAGEPATGPTVRWLRRQAQHWGIYLGTSFLEASGEDFFNTFVLAGPDGQERGRVRKQTPAAFEACFTRGDAGPHVIETEIGRVGVGICYENQLSFLPRLMAAQNVDLLLMPHSAPTPKANPLYPRRIVAHDEHALETLAVRYARMLGIPTIMANKCGPWDSPILRLPMLTQHTYFPGFSAIADSDGAVKAQLGKEAGIIVETVTLDPARKVHTLPARRDRWARCEPAGKWMFAGIEALGRALYAASRKRRRSARAISASNDAPHQGNR
ncbi:MAG: glycine--tRNA ligase, partial [Anaerolineae bacterium]|nr:glycine--tRNA ligase [Anaerolineae bacterium]